MKYIAYSVVWICAMVVSLSGLYFLRSGWAMVVLLLPCIVTDSILVEKDRKEVVQNGGQL